MENSALVGCHAQYFEVAGKRSSKLKGQKRFLDFSEIDNFPVLYCLSLKKMITGFFVKVTDVVADVMLTSDRFRFDLKHVLLYLASLYNVKVLFV